MRKFLKPAGHGDMRNHAALGFLILVLSARDLMTYPFLGYPPTPRLRERFLSAPFQGKSFLPMSSVNTVMDGQRAGQGWHQLGTSARKTLRI